MVSTIEQSDALEIIQGQLRRIVQGKTETVLTIKPKGERPIEVTAQNCRMKRTPRLGSYLTISVLMGQVMNLYEADRLM